MNLVIKFLVTILFVVVVCANVGARPLDEVSKDVMDRKTIFSSPPLPLLPSPLLPSPLLPSPLLPSPLLPSPLLPSLSPPLSPLPPALQPSPAPEVEVSGIKGGELTNGGNEGVMNRVGKVSKDTKIGLSVHKTTTSGLGTMLSVSVNTDGYTSEYSSSNAAAGPGGPSAGSSGNAYVGTGGFVYADGPNAYGYSGSSVNGQGNSNAAAGPSGATASGDGYGNGNSYAYGETYNP